MRHILRVLLILVMSAASPVTARTRPGVPLTGIVEYVDTKGEEVEMLREDDHTIVKFTWGSRTTFIANGQRADVSLLKTGTRVEVIYYKPFFREASTWKVTFLPVVKLQTSSK